MGKVRRDQLVFLVCLLPTLSLLLVLTTLKLHFPVMSFRSERKTHRVGVVEVQKILHATSRHGESNVSGCSINSTRIMNGSRICPLNSTSPLAAPSPTMHVVFNKSATCQQRIIASVESFLKEIPPESPYSSALAKVIGRAKSRTLQSGEQAWQKDELESQQDNQFLKYMTKCPTSLRQKMVAEPYASHKYVPETPILAWNEHYSTEEYERLSNFHGIYGWKDMNGTDIASALAALNSSHNKYLFDDRMVNDSISRGAECIRCAVVGNGGILNGSRKGREIDANDYVFRVNTALTKGHEVDVGTRTSFYGFGIVTLSNTLAGGRRTGFRQPPNDEGVRYIFFADNKWAYPYLSAALNRRPLPRSSTGRGPPRFPKQLTPKDVKLVHPDFERYLKFRWVNSSRQHKPIHRPTTGGILLLLALHTCDEVNAYGFAGSTEKFSDHYYDKTFTKHRRYANHDNKAEDNLWNELHKRGVMSLYKRKD